LKFTLCGAPIVWRSKLQASVAPRLSTTESEYVELSAAAQEAVHLRRQLADMGAAQPAATIIHEDNLGALFLAGNLVLHQRTKHMDIKVHYLRELVAAKTIDVAYIPIADQLADIFTNLKPLAAPRHAALTALLVCAAP
jgi:hypothetical protein